MDDIVVGIDRSDTAREALAVAARLAADCGCPLHIVMCVARDTRTISSGSDRWHVDSIASAEQFVDSLGLELPTGDLTRAISFDDPASVLCEEAERLDARMIVVGNRRVKGAARLLGSVASDVLKHAPCHVLVANTTGS